MGREMRELVADGVLGSVLRQVTYLKQTGGTGENFAGNFIVEKWHEFVLLLQNLLHGVGEIFAGNFIVEKWHEFVLLLQNLLHGVGEIFAGNFIVEKWHEFVLLLQNLLHRVAAYSWVILIVAILLISLPLLFCCLPYLIIVVGAAGSAIFSCLSFLCSSIFRVIMAVVGLIGSLVTGLLVCVKSCFPCFFSVGGKMMRAPGMAGVWILRATFESNPAAYFRLLRA